MHILVEGSKVVRTALVRMLTLFQCHTVHNVSTETYRHYFSLLQNMPSGTFHSLSFSLFLIYTHVPMKICNCRLIIFLINSYIQIRIQNQTSVVSIKFQKPQFYLFCVFFLSQKK